MPQRADDAGTKQWTNVAEWPVDVVEQMRKPNEHQEHVWHRPSVPKPSARLKTWLEPRSEANGDHRLGWMFDSTRPALCCGMLAAVLATSWCGLLFVLPDHTMLCVACVQVLHSLGTQH